MPRKRRRSASLGHRRPSKHLKGTRKTSRVRNEATASLGRPKIADSESSSSDSSNSSFCSKDLIMDDMHSVETIDAEKEASDKKRDYWTLPPGVTQLRICL